MNISKYNVKWETQSDNSSNSMPCGGFDTGSNIWVENNEILIYMDRSGHFDEANQMLKVGRFRITFEENVLATDFSQELDLLKGSVIITGKGTKVEVWFDTTCPKCNIEVYSENKSTVKVGYEYWRYEDRDGAPASFGYNGYTGSVKTYKDTVLLQNGVTFYHQNKNDNLIFDFEMKQQYLDHRKDDFINLQKDFIFGGVLQGEDCINGESYSGKYSTCDFKGYNIVSENKNNHYFTVTLHSEQNPCINDYLKNLYALASKKSDRSVALNWWKEFWDVSYIEINGEKDDSDKGYQVGRNYNLFRYILGCNAYGKYPSKFNGGCFLTDAEYATPKNYPQDATPDYRVWGGGSFTGQNQRLVYWSMIKSGDFEMMKPQFDFYNNVLKNATIRTKEYWGHDGCSFTEQLENSGLPAGCSWGFPKEFANGEARTRPDYWDKTTQVNLHVRYDFNSQLEFAYMILRYYDYSLKDISEYIPFIEGCVTFFFEHYKMINKKTVMTEYDAQDKLVIFPSTALEMYKNATNPVDSVSALLVIVDRLSKMPEYVDCEKYKEMYTHIPNIKVENGIIEPAHSYNSKSTNMEIPQMYPVFPYGLYGVGRDGLDIVKNTWNNLPEKIKTMKSNWHQECIFAPRMGDRELSKINITRKLEDSVFRFPAFWGPDYSCVPDLNWGGCGSIGLEEMIIQDVDNKIYILPAWSSDWNIKCKLYLPKKVQIEIDYTNGKLNYTLTGEHKDEFEYIACL